MKEKTWNELLDGARESHSITDREGNELLRKALDSELLHKSMKSPNLMMDIEKFNEFLMGVIAKRKENKNKEVA